MSKATQNWVAKNPHERTQQLPMRKDLLARLMGLRAMEPLKKKQHKKHPSFPRPNIAKKEKPPMSLLLSQRSDRFSHQRKNK